MFLIFDTMVYLLLVLLVSFGILTCIAYGLAYAINYYI